MTKLTLVLERKGIGANEGITERVYSDGSIEIEYPNGDTCFCGPPFVVPPRDTPVAVAIDRRTGEVRDICVEVFGKCEHRENP